MKKLLSLSAVALLLIFTGQAFAGHGGGHHGMHNGGGYGGMRNGGGYGGMHNGGGGLRYAGGYGAGYNYGGGYGGNSAGYNYGGYRGNRLYGVYNSDGGNGGYGAGYNVGGGYGDVVVVGGSDVPEQIYVYRQAPIMPYSYGRYGNCCRCQ